MLFPTLKIVTLPITTLGGDLPRRKRSFSLWSLFSRVKEQLFETQMHPEQLSAYAMQVDMGQWGWQRRKCLWPWWWAWGSLTPTFQGTIHWKVLQDSGGMPWDVHRLHISAASHEGHAVSAWAHWYRNAWVTRNHHPLQEQTTPDNFIWWRQNLKCSRES